MRLRWRGTVGSSSTDPTPSLWSTAADLVRFGPAFLRDGRLDDYRLLGPLTIRTMTALQTGNVAGLVRPRGPCPYDELGFFKVGPQLRSGPSPELRTTDGFGHEGSTDSYQWIEPNPGIVFVILSNRWGPKQPPEILRALNAVLDAADDAHPGTA